MIILLKVEDDVDDEDEDEDDVGLVVDDAVVAMFHLHLIVKSGEQNFPVVRVRKRH